MTTVVSRTIRAIPHRDAPATWQLIVDLLTHSRQSAARAELMSVAGICASIIADQGPKFAPIVVTCEGPRSRIYCIYNDDAVDGADANEEAFGFNPLKGDWAVSLPCHSDDLDWVRASLKKQSARITARDVEAGISTEEAKAAAAESLVLDPKGFLGS